MNAALELAPSAGMAPACRALAVARATAYRWKAGDGVAPRELQGHEIPASDPAPRESPRALEPGERQAVLDVLHLERFMNRSPAEVHATLLDEGKYLCSERTMYRILAEHGETRERRDQLVHPTYKKPELLATGPNQVWSWDITKLLGPAKWTYFYLYVLLDIFSRYVVGWMVAHRESATLAKRLIEDTCGGQRIEPGQLTVHADRGTSMTSKTVAQLMADMGITKTHSRPHVSNDNPFSESQFKTLKYCPEFPGRFGCIEDAHAFLRPFFTWYNREHRHSGIGMLTPEDVHYGRGPAVLEMRATVLAAAYAAKPERFVRGSPRPAPLPAAVWINPPAAGGGLTGEIGQ